MRKISLKTTLVIGIGIALFFVFGRFVSVPINFGEIDDMYVTIQYGVLAFIAAVFGPIAGFFVGFLGHFLIDFSNGELWWGWIISSACFGFLIGLVSFKMKIDDGEFRGKDMAIFNIAQVVAHFLTWGLIAPTIDILMYPTVSVTEEFVQGLTSAASNSVTTAIVGSILCVAYAAARPQKEDFKKDE